MKHKYPAKARWITLNRCSEGVRIENNLCGSAYIVSEKLAYCLDRLDGKTDPYTAHGCSAEYIDAALDFFEEEELTRFSNCLLKEKGRVYYTVWIPKDSCRGGRFASKWINRILQIIWWPLSVIALFLADGYYGDGGMLSFYIGGIAGLIIGAVLHEIAHATATWAAGGEVYEFGIMRDGLIPGAYALIDEGSNLDSMQKVQINAAGFECNYLLMALLLLVGSHTPVPTLFFGAALINAILGTGNMILPREGLDGEHVLSAFLEVDSIAERANLIINQNRLRNRIQSEGMTGLAVIVFLYWIKLNQMKPIYYGKLMLLEVFGSYYFCRLILF